MGRKEYDCQACGACCMNPKYNRKSAITEYVQVFPTDILFSMKGLRAQWTVRNSDDEWHMRLEPDGRCSALQGKIGDHATCGIYDLRPSVCRRLEPGSDKCITARREHGLDPRP